MPFRDYFSSQAKEYARHRPVYPEAMFNYLASLAPSKELAWDCGTGNGQAAMALAKNFRRVIATDASAAQINNAFPHERVEYLVEPAEKTTNVSNSVDLITVGTAVHWFDFDAFYQEVQRVSKPGGILAVWTYYFPVIEPEIDSWLKRFYWETLNGYWPERIHYLEERYKTLPFPFEEIEPPKFEMKATWELGNLIGFLGSWSAVKKLIDTQGDTTFEEPIKELERLWGDNPDKREIRWPLHFRIGKLSQA
ncbi:MAG: class I SAM-dependent methyltransferase [Anaerolineales bacterium]